MNALLCAVAVGANMHYQFFCRPVLWASILLVIVFVPVVLYPLVRRSLTPIRELVFFTFGVAACACVYCIMFLGMMNWWAPFIMWIKPLAILGYLPHFLLVQILFNLYDLRNDRKVRRSFVVGVSGCVAFALAMAIWFNRNYESVQAAIDDPRTKSGNVSACYMTERMLGMHFKYHMSFCMWDGWRPPIHAPSIVVAAWLNSPFIDTQAADGFLWTFLNMSAAPFKDHMTKSDLERRVDAYSRVFPDRPIRQKCPCAAEYGKVYLNDPLWRSRFPRER
ncbi:MAG: hypothetical protein KF905_16720 [Flavobacteriales bacterium]|nr:hypothetical protein [Flavobacteriales bacterium]